ncbi:hypothetical protein ABEB36_014461 [Hypothenemus hampei]|uniref:Uncharacterized protein n=1 Tax=Hypothenemus hampei TaxID=57062 RepID=A0ABD1E1V5_HYPHA
MIAAAAKSYHEFSIMENCEEDAYVALANAQRNPLDRQVSHLYEQWRLKNYGSRDSNNLIDILKRKQTELQALNSNLCIKENPIICVLVTPIMQRVYMTELVNEMIFIDTSGSCDQTNTCITFIFVASKVGALPICIINRYYVAFGTYRY